MKKLKVLIIDDERNAREEIKLLLKSYPDVEIIGEAKKTVIETNCKHITLYNIICM